MIKPKVKVQEMDMLEDIKTRADKLRNGLITSTGIKNAYRYAFARGEGASRKDETWNKVKHSHTCCGSKVPWRHLVSCELLKDSKIDSYLTQQSLDGGGGQ